MGDFSGHPFRGNQYTGELYHGTDRIFERFETGRAGEMTAAIGDWAGAYFTPDKGQAEGIARHAARMSGRQPIVRRVRVTLKNAAEWGQFKTREAAEAAGFDGRVFRDSEGKVTEVTAFYPDQIEFIDGAGWPPARNVGR